MGITAVIIEDEKPAARRLSRMLEKVGVTVEKILHSVEEAKTWFPENTHPDLLFLDIQLNDGLSFEIFEEHQTKAAVIFTTAYDEYALQAFQLNSIDYLLKPIDTEDLQQAVDKFKALKDSYTRLSMENLQHSFEDIKTMLLHPEERMYKKRFTIRIGQHLKMIPVEEICCFYSENKGTYLSTFSGRSYLLESTLETLEDQLDPKTFFRVNRKFIISVSAIKEIVSYSNSRLKVHIEGSTDAGIIVARERVRDFKSWLG